MTLQEAIEEVKRLGVVGLWEPDEFAFGMTEECRAAIATILNAVVDGSLILNVKGELKWVQ